MSFPHRTQIYIYIKHKFHLLAKCTCTQIADVSFDSLIEGSVDKNTRKQKHFSFLARQIRWRPTFCLTSLLVEYAANTRQQHFRWHRSFQFIQLLLRSCFL
uniref:Uncharacterized protein n=1 Tax=Opuntia streptacantha TaxID=393608 RepID=A0A7C9CZP5_OPUST